MVAEADSAAECATYCAREEATFLPMHLIPEFAIFCALSRRDVATVVSPPRVRLQRHIEKAAWKRLRLRLLQPRHIPETIQLRAATTGLLPHGQGG